MGEVVETLYLNPNYKLDNQEIIYQTISVARVADDDPMVSVIIFKSYKNYPSVFGQVHLSRDEAIEVVLGILEALKSEPRSWE